VDSVFDVVGVGRHVGGGTRTGSGRRSGVDTVGRENRTGKSRLRRLSGKNRMNLRKLDQLPGAVLVGKLRVKLCIVRPAT